MQKSIIKIASVVGAGLLLASCVARKPKHQPMPKKIDSTQLVIKPTKPQWTPPLGDSIKPEMRAVWLTLVAGLDWPHVKADTPDGVRKQKESLERILDRLVEDGYNTVFFQARQSGSVNYYSDEPFNKVFTSDASRPAYDPLAFAVEACHKRGLKIHAWVVTYPLVSKGTPKHPIIEKHPEWAIPHMGSYHLDPGLPEVRTHIAKLVSDIARRYQVDGIHFDYFRYPEEAGRYNDSRSYKLYGEGEDKAAWRRENLTLQLQEVQDSLMNVRPDVQVSVAPLGKLRKLPSLGKAHGWTAYDDVYQDAEEWAKHGLVDFLAPMMYYKDYLYEPFLIDWQERVGRYVPVVAGLAPYRTEPTESGWPITVIKEQIELARKYKAGGVSMFREGNIGPRRPYLRTLIQEQFKYKALYPELARGKANKPAVPRGLSLKLTGKHITLSWMMPEQKVTGITYRVWCTAVHANGTEESYIVKEGLEQTVCSMLLANFNAGDKLIFGVEAVNSFGVSTPSEVSAEFRFTQTLGSVLPSKTN